MNKYLALTACVVLSALAGIIWAVDKVATNAKLGAEAPAFTLKDQSGKDVSLADYKGKIVVLEWFNDGCPYVQRHYTGGNMNHFASKYADKGVVWLAINSTNGKTAADNEKIAAEWKIDRPILLDADGQVGHAYGAKTTPDMFVIDKAGKLVYTGAIDNVRSTDADDNAKASNYVAKALDDLLAGKAVGEPETKSYGCGVKY